MSKQIVIKLHAGLGAAFPDDPVNGRFRTRGVVIEGTKPMLGRSVEIDMTRLQLETLVNMGAEALLRHPNCGTMPQNEDNTERPSEKVMRLLAERKDDN